MENKKLFTAMLLGDNKHMGVKYGSAAYEYDS